MLLLNLSLSNLPLEPFFCLTGLLLAAIVLVDGHDGGVLNSRPTFGTLVFKFKI